MRLEWRTNETTGKLYLEGTPYAVLPLQGGRFEIQRFAGPESWRWDRIGVELSQRAAVSRVAIMVKQEAEFSASA